MTAQQLHALRDPRLTALRRALSAAMARRDDAEIDRISAEHRALLHALSPDTAAAWRRSMERA